MTRNHLPLRLLAALLLAVFCCTAAPTVAVAAPAVSAAEAVASGICGAKLSWTLTADGTLTISGTGDMYDYIGPGTGDAPWCNYDDRITAVVLQEGVTSVGNFAFYQYPLLKSVHLSGGLTRIGESAFVDCAQLQEIRLPSGLKEIGARAFYGCKSLRTLTLPEKITSIETATFAHCTSLQEMELPSGVIAVRRSAFAGCSSLKEVRLHGSVLFIGPDAFSTCKQLRRVIYAGTAVQWYDMIISSGNDYLRSVPVEFVSSLDPDELLPAETLTYRFYSSAPYTALANGETMDLRVELFRSDGTQLTPDNTSLISGSACVIDYQTLPDAWLFTVRGRYETYLDAMFQVSERRSAASLPLYSWSGVHAFECNSPWSPAAVRSTLCLDNFQCRCTSSSDHDITVDAYNTAYSYGAAVVYDPQGGLLDVQPIPAKINDGSDVTVDGVRYMAVDLTALTALGTRWYTAGTAFPLSLHRVPSASEVRLTVDGSESAYPALFTSIDVLARWIAADAGLSLTGAQQQTLSLALIRAAWAKLTPEEAARFGGELHTALASGNTDCNIISILYNMYSSVSVDVAAAAADALGAMNVEARNLPDQPPTEASLTALLTQHPELGWPAMDYAFNLNRGGTVIHTDAQTINALTHNTLQVSSDRPFDVGTVLDARLPTAELGDNAACADGLTDCLLYQFRLLKMGQEYVPADAFELPHRTLTVHLPLTEAQQQGSVAVYRIEPDGSRTYISAQVQDGFAVFETDRPGKFIAGCTTRTTPGLAAGLLGTLTLAAGLALGLFLRRRKRHPSTKSSEV